MSSQLEIKTAELEEVKGQIDECTKKGQSPPADLARMFWALTNIVEHHQRLEEDPNYLDQYLDDDEDDDNSGVELSIDDKILRSTRHLL